jgi:transposase
MAPNLDNAKHLLLQSMLVSGRYSASQIANTVKCSARTVRHAHSNLQDFGSTKAPENSGRRLQKITPAMTEGMCKHLEKNPTMLQSELVEFVEETFGIRVFSRRIVVEALSSVGWVAKVGREEPIDTSVDGATNIGDDCDSTSPAGLDKADHVTKPKGQKARRVRRHGSELRAYSTQGWGLRYRRRIKLQKTLEKPEGTGQPRLSIGIHVDD